MEFALAERPPFGDLFAQQLFVIRREATQADALLLAICRMKTKPRVWLTYAISRKANGGRRRKTGEEIDPQKRARREGATEGRQRFTLLIKSPIDIFSSGFHE